MADNLPDPHISGVAALRRATGFKYLYILGIWGQHHSN